MIFGTRRKKKKKYAKEREHSRAPPNWLHDLGDDQPSPLF